MRVAWLIPVRDEVRWLRTAVASALAECGAADEVIVIDDGSVVPVEPELPRDARVRLLRMPRNGIACALEAGRKVTQAEFLARLDADDEALPGRLLLQRAALAEDAALAVVGGGMELVGVDGLPPGEGMRAYAEWINAVSDPAAEIFAECPLLHPAMMLRASAVAAVGGWCQGDFPEDYDLVLRLHAEGHRLGTVRAPVVRVRDHAQRASRSDPRYRGEAFDVLRRRGLRATPLRGPRRITLWCGPRAGKAWMRWLLAEGMALDRIIDIRPSHARLGIPVMPPAGLVGHAVDLLLVAVGSRGARPLIRARIAELRPDLREGEHWFFVR